MTDTQPHILIIEDEELLAGVLQEKLTEAGFRVSRAKDGEEGLAMAVDSQPNLIVTDILLPVLDGRTMITKMREAGVASPIIALTNLEATDDVAAVLTGERDQVLKKTYYTLENLITTISTSARHAV